MSGQLIEQHRPTREDYQAGLKESCDMYRHCLTSKYNIVAAFGAITAGLVTLFYYRLQYKAGTQINWIPILGAAVSLGAGFFDYLVNQMMAKAADCRQEYAKELGLDQLTASSFSKWWRIAFQVSSALLYLLAIVSWLFLTDTNSPAPSPPPSPT